LYRAARRGAGNARRRARRKIYRRTRSDQARTDRSPGGRPGGRAVHTAHPARAGIPFPPRDPALPHRSAAAVAAARAIGLRPSGAKGSMNILMLTGEFPPAAGGIGTYAREVAAAAVRLGADVTVVAPDYAAPSLARDDRALPFRIRRFAGGQHS